VGKGITFDTGGLQIKGRAGMEGMKTDLGGAAAVLAAFEVLVTLQVPLEAGDLTLVHHFLNSTHHFLSST